MENHFVKYSLLKKRMTVKIKDPKKRSMHRIYIHTNRLINSVNQVFFQTGVSLSCIDSKVCSLLPHGLKCILRLISDFHTLDGEVVTTKLILNLK